MATRIPEGIPSEASGEGSSRTNAVLGAEGGRDEREGGKNMTRAERDAEIASLTRAARIQAMAKEMESFPMFQGADTHVLARNLYGCTDFTGLLMTMQTFWNRKSAKIKAAMQARSTAGKRGSAATKEPTLDEFRRMSFRELSRLQREQPDVYQRLLYAERGW